MVRRCQEGMSRLVAESRPLFAGSGAEGAFVTFPTPDRITIGWIGAARVYLLGQHVKQLSRDHTLLNDYLLAVPELTPEQIAEIPAKVTTRSIGALVEIDHPMVQPEVREVSLEADDVLVLVPRGIDETILDDPRLCELRSPEAMAKLVVAHAIEHEPDVSSGAIVLRRASAAAVKKPTTPIRALIARCPDEATESVIADWCEENERRALVPWLRSAIADVRFCAVQHLAATLDGVATREAFFAARRLARVLEMRTSYGLVADLSFADAQTRPCPTCGHPAWVGRDGDGASAHDGWTLCVRELHVVPIGEGPRSRNK